MNNKAVTMEELATITFGVELEYENITREDAANAVARATGGTVDYTTQYEAHSPITVVTPDGRKWKCETDGSLDRGCETVSPNENGKMETEYLYFAYGSNLDDARLLGRVGADARPVGRGVADGWTVEERLYADMRRRRGAKAYGMVWRLTEDAVAALDRFEGWPTTYADAWVDVTLLDSGIEVKAMAYVMTDAARASRRGKKYPDDYRAICSAGARAHGLPDAFAAAG